MYFLEYVTNQQKVTAGSIFDISLVLLPAESIEGLPAVITHCTMFSTFCQILDPSDVTHATTIHQHRTHSMPTFTTINPDSVESHNQE